MGGQPYWSWYGFTSRVEWCACFVSWCYGQMGLSEPPLFGLPVPGHPLVPVAWTMGGPDYANIAPGDAIFFDWDLDGRADHVGIVVGTDGSKVYTVEGKFRRRLQDQELLFDLRVHQGLRPDELVIFAEV